MGLSFETKFIYNSFFFSFTFTKTRKRWKELDLVIIVDVFLQSCVLSRKFVQVYLHWLHLFFLNLQWLVKIKSAHVVCSFRIQTLPIYYIIIVLYKFPNCTTFFSFDTFWSHLKYSFWGITNCFSQPQHLSRSVLQTLTSYQNHIPLSLNMRVHVTL